MNVEPRRASIVAALATIPMIVLGPLAAFGVLADGPAGLAMTVVAALDVVVALALWPVLGPGLVALLAVGLRLVYAAVLAVAAAGLAAGDRAGFDRVWDPGLVLFGLHLVAVGAALAPRRDGFARATGILVVVAGAGYVVDSTGALLVPGLDLGVAGFTFVGELLLIVWLLVRGGRPDAVPTASRPTIA